MTCEPILDHNQHIVYKLEHVSEELPGSIAGSSFNHKSKSCEINYANSKRSYIQKNIRLNSNRYRYKRSSRYQPKNGYTIEVLVIIDNSVSTFHNWKGPNQDNTQAYIITIMNMVDDIYKDDSLIENMRVVISGILLLDGSSEHENLVLTDSEDYGDRNAARADEDQTLKNVCEWSKIQKDKEPNAHDVSVFLTKKNFGGLQGYAKSGGMCDSSRSCSIIRENGFNGAFVISHEIGHVLGMEHDGTDSCKKFNFDQGISSNPLDHNYSFNSKSNLVMWPVIQSTFRSFTWSECANHALTQNLRKHKMKCLWDYHDDIKSFTENWGSYDSTKKLPGELYSLEEQCQRQFGKDWTICKLMKNMRADKTGLGCKYLFCQHREGYFCKSVASKQALEGSTCDVGKKCWRGECL